MTGPLFVPERASLIPAELRERASWVCWRLDPGDPKPRKVPINATTGRLASSTNPATWALFETALEAVERSNGTLGLGFVFSERDPYVGIDLDACFGPDGSLSSYASTAVEKLASYTERSPSGTGLHVLVRGRLAAGIKRKHVEVYAAGRYFTITGDLFRADLSEIRQSQIALDEIVARETPRTRSSSGVSASTGPEPWRAVQVVIRPDAMPPHEKHVALLEASPRFADTWNHDRPDLKDQSLSSYDLALASQAKAAWWSDQEVADLLVAFRRLHGNSDKATRTDYIQRTIARATVQGGGADGETPSEAGSEPTAEQARQHIQRALKMPIVRYQQVGQDNALYVVILEDGTRKTIGTARQALEQDRWRAIRMELYGAPFAPLKGPAWTSVLEALAYLRELLDPAETGPTAELAEKLSDLATRLPVIQPGDEGVEVALGPYVERREPYIHEGMLHVTIEYLQREIARDRVSPDLRHRGTLIGSLRALGYARYAALAVIDVGNRADRKRICRSYWSGEVPAHSE